MKDERPSATWSGIATIPNKGTCALCQQVAELRKSHIIPEFLYGTLYDDKNRFKTFGKLGEPEVGLEQKGFRERLLCDVCEQHFSRWERVAALFYQGTLKAFEAQKPEITVNGLKFTRVSSSAKPTTEKVPELLHVEGIDYKPLKLFLLSLLWRMGVSKQHFFREVVLGPHEMRIRRMLLTDAPGEPGEYSCQICLIETKGRLLTDYQSQPQKSRRDGLTFYRLYSTGVRFDFCVSNQQVHPGWIGLYCFKRQDSFTWCVDSVQKHPDLIVELKRFGSAMGWDRR